jgi:transposase
LLEFVPAALRVIEHVRLKYACRRCQKHVAVAGKPAQPIERGLPEPGLLAHTITSKYSDHLPPYRGMELSRSTMCAWMRQSAADLESPALQNRRALSSSASPAWSASARTPIAEIDLRNSVQTP